MKIVIANAQVPFVSGGAENLAYDLQEALIKHGHEVELIKIPFQWYPPEKIPEHREHTGDVVDYLTNLRIWKYCDHEGIARLDVPELFSISLFVETKRERFFWTTMIGGGFRIVWPAFFRRLKRSAMRGHCSPIIFTCSFYPLASNWPCSCGDC